MKGKQCKLVVVLRITIGQEYEKPMRDMASLTVKATVSIISIHSFSMISASAKKKGGIWKAIPDGRTHKNKEYHNAINEARKLNWASVG